jgi:tRNA(Leu) C34 or U34 (ribose-2'-O)-methylase TrmL
MKGFVGIGLDRPKSRENLGGVVRAAGCYGAQVVTVKGERMGGSYKTDTQDAFKRIPVMKVEDLLESMPNGCTPVVIEIIAGAKSLIDFVHPERAFYIFGPEDGCVEKRIMQTVQRRVFVPTNGCMSLAATVNVVLYDRLAKRRLLDESE